jgi:iron(III) transport system ATP-binding protein
MWLELDDVEVAFGERVALAGLSFGLQEGEIGCLLGPSGCGKTTALRSIAGFERIDRGRITARDRVLAAPGVSVPPHERGIGIVFQDYALFPHLTVRGNVEFGLRGLPPHERRERSAMLLGMLGLGDRHDAWPSQLSGGQLQRVALARALAPRPETLLLDEPVSSLDPALRERVVGELRAMLRELETTALVVTHDQYEAFALADRVGVMSHGRLEQWSTPYDAYHRPATRFVAEFVGKASFLPARRTSSGELLTELGPVRDPRGGSAAECEVMLRPDDVVHDDASPLQARIVAREFRGAEFLYSLELASGRRVLSLVPSHHDHRVGEPIGIRLAADHVVTFEAGDGRVSRVGAASAPGTTEPPRGR